MTHTTDSNEQLNKCATCGMSDWSCNRLQDLVYDDMTLVQKRDLAVRIREDMTLFITQQREQARQELLDELERDIKSIALTMGRESYKYLLDKIASHRQPHVEKENI